MPMAIEFASVSRVEKERAFITAKNAGSTKATYGQATQWYYDITAAFATLGNGYDFLVCDGSDTSRINNAGLALGLVWPSTGIPAGSWGRNLVFGEHPAAQIYSVAENSFGDLYDDAEKTGAEFSAGVLRPIGLYDSTASRAGYLGWIAWTSQAVDEGGSATYTVTAWAEKPGGYAVPIGQDNGGAGITTSGTAPVFCKFLG